MRQHPRNPLTIPSWHNLITLQTRRTRESIPTLPYRTRSLSGIGKSTKLIIPESRSSRIEGSSWDIGGAKGENLAALGAALVDVVGVGEVKTTGLAGGVGGERDDAKCTGGFTGGLWDGLLEVYNGGQEWVTREMKPQLPPLPEKSG